MKRHLSLLALGLITFVGSSEAAEISETSRAEAPLTLRATLTESDGQAVHGQQNLVIRFFDGPRGRELLQVVLAQHADNPVPNAPVYFDANGEFEATLTAAHSLSPAGYRSATELLATQPKVWLSIVRGNQAETPRTPVIRRGTRLVAETPNEKALVLSLSEDPWTAQSITLATFQLPHRGSLEFVAIPELGEVGIVESFPLEQSLRFTTEEADPLELYLALAPADLPVPQALLWTAEDPELASGRVLVNQLSEQIWITEEALEDAAKIPDYPTNHFCGSDGQGFFEVVCNSYNTGGINFCESGAWYSVDRNSYSGGWQKKKKQSAIVGSCNTSVAVKLRYRGLCGFSYCWKNADSYTVAYGKSSGRAYSGAVKRRRRNEYRRNDSGYFRAHTSFY